MRVYLLDSSGGSSPLRAWFALGVGRWKSVVMLPDEIWDFAERLRAEAVPVVDRYFRAADLAVEHKADVSPVTRADKAIELRWREMIAETFLITGSWGRRATLSVPTANSSGSSTPSTAPAPSSAGSRCSPTCLLCCTSATRFRRHLRPGDGRMVAGADAGRAPDHLPRSATGQPPGGGAENLRAVSHCAGYVLCGRVRALRCAARSLR